VCVYRALFAEESDQFDHFLRALVYTVCTTTFNADRFCAAVLSDSKPPPRLCAALLPQAKPPQDLY
jgi:hypothetical protein